MRRLTRQGGRLIAWSVAPHILSRNALRKIDYHLRSRRAAAIFARCWVLVEGETEFWVLPEMARILGYDLAAEGVACVEFAQSGPQPLLKVAAQFGIGCHVLTDGDHAGLGYSAVTAKYMPGTPPASVAVTTLDEPDIEHSFWNHGFARRNNPGCQCRHRCRDPLSDRRHPSCDRSNVQALPGTRPRRSSGPPWALERASAATFCHRVGRKDRACQCWIEPFDHAGASLM